MFSLARFVGTTIISNNTRIAVTPAVTQTRGMKYKDVLQLRCQDCYYKSIDNVWHVLCTKHGRHKQSEIVPKKRFRYIVSERVTMGYPAYKKRYMYPGHILS